MLRRSVGDNLTNGSCPEEVTGEMAVGSRTAGAHDFIMETVGGPGAQRTLNLAPVFSCGTSHFTLLVIRP